MSVEAPCVFVRAEADGRVVVRRGQTEETDLVFGVDLVTPLPANYAEFVARRLGNARKPLQCTARGPDAEGRPRATFVYYAMQDKSGDIWIDLATDLLDAGMATLSAEPFPERAEYQTHVRSP